MGRLDAAKELLEAAKIWKVECLEKGGSLFEKEDLWTYERFKELKENFVDRPDTGNRKFLEKLEDQLRSASSGSKRLFAEMIWLHGLLAENTPEAKLSKIRMVYEWSDRSLPQTDLIDLGLLGKGFIRVGKAYGQNEWRDIRFVILAMLKWTQLPIQERSLLLEDPWKFAVWVDAQPEAKGRQFRHVWLYLLFPDHFQPIVSSEPKVKIVSALGDNSSNAVLSNIDLDMALQSIREKLQKAHPGREINFYQEPFKSMWNEGGAGDKLESAAEAEEDSEKAVDAWFKAKFGDADVWTIAPGKGACYWDEFVSKGIAAIGWGWEEVGDLSEHSSIDELGQRFIETGISEDPINHKLAGWEFTHEMKIGDVLLAREGKTRILGLGYVSSGYVYESDKTDLRSVRDVEWKRFDQPIEFGPITTKRLTRFSKYKSDVREIFRLIEGVRGYDIHDALRDVFTGEQQFRRIVDQLGWRKNLILQGAPGVGKTFIAKRIAWSLIGEKVEDRIRLIQFHQSYAYEDFVQGWRPTETGGFTLQTGAFYDFCERARNQSDQKFVFIIDEINRGNLSRIFGELLMLIEADKRGVDYSVSLTYDSSDQQFFIPENVYILGLMNTADRSLAIVDYALRRRFVFETLRPAFGTNAFRSHLRKFGVDDGLMERINANFIGLNERICEDKDLGEGFEIGHSYFTPDEESEADENWYKNVIETQIKPLLREYWFDRPEKVAEEFEKLQQ